MVYLRRVDFFKEDDPWEPPKGTGTAGAAVDQRRKGRVGGGARSCLLGGKCHRSFCRVGAGQGVKQSIDSAPHGADRAFAGLPNQFSGHHPTGGELFIPADCSRVHGQTGKGRQCRQSRSDSRCRLSRSSSRGGVRIADTLRKRVVLRWSTAAPPDVERRGRQRVFEEAGV